MPKNNPNIPIKNFANNTTMAITTKATKITPIKDASINNISSNVSNMEILYHI